MPVAVAAVQLLLADGDSVEVHAPLYDPTNRSDLHYIKVMKPSTRPKIQRETQHLRASRPGGGTAPRAVDLTKGAQSYRLAYVWKQ